MKHILSRENIELVARAAWSNVLVAFDFDGTLAPIVADRDAAGMRARTRKLLGEVCAIYPCAVVSGRSKSDVTQRLGGVAVKYVVGNHGLEQDGDLQTFESIVSKVKPEIEAALEGQDGLDVEDKRYSLAVHYRRSRRKGEARDAIHAAAAKLPVQMRIVTGKLVVNLVPPGAPNKGDALLHLRTVEGADTALFVGDDVTDEDVFCLDQPGRLLAIRVGMSKSSAAAFYLRDQQEMDVLLETLVAFGKERVAHDR